MPMIVSEEFLIEQIVNTNSFTPIKACCFHPKMGQKHFNPSSKDFCNAPVPCSNKKSI